MTSRVPWNDRWPIRIHVFQWRVFTNIITSWPSLLNQIKIGFHIITIGSFLNFDANIILRQRFSNEKINQIVKKKIFTTILILWLLLVSISLVSNVGSLELTSESLIFDKKNSTVLTKSSMESFYSKQHCT